MHFMIKSRLQSFFLSNKPRVENRQRDLVGLGLVKWRCESLFDKACLNILRTKNITWVGVEPSMEHNNKAGIWGDNKAGIGEDNKVGIGRNDKAGIRRRDKAGREKDNKVGTERQDKIDTRGDNKVGTKRQNKTGIGKNYKISIEGRNKVGTGEDNKADTEGRDNKASIEKQNNKKVTKLLARACHIRVERLLYYTFFLAMHSNFFLVSTFSQFIIDWSLSLSLIANSGLSVTLINRDVPSSR